MNTADVELWLKSSIWGLILLGAIGSVVAVMAIKVATKLASAFYSGLTKYLPETTERYLLNITKDMASVYHSLHALQNQHAFLVFVAFSMIKFVLLLLASVLSLLLLVKCVVLAPQSSALALTFLLATVFVLASLGAFRIFLGFGIAYRQEVRPFILRSQGRISDDDFHKWLRHIIERRQKITQLAGGRVPDAPPVEEQQSTAEEKK